MQRLGGVVAKGGWRCVEVLVEGQLAIYKPQVNRLKTHSYGKRSIPRMQRLGAMEAKGGWRCVEVLVEGGWRCVEVLVEGATGNLQTTSQSAENPQLWQEKHTQKAGARSSTCPANRGEVASVVSRGSDEL
jgi:hypothetical protein